MDKIYSRRKIDISNFLNVKRYRNNNKKEKKKLFIFNVIVIIIVAMLTAYIIIKAITPVIDKNCLNIAKSIATKISNEQASIIMNQYKYDDLCSVTKDNLGNILMISANVKPINEIVSNITIGIQDELNRNSNSNFKIKLGTFSGLKILSGRGPDVNIKMSTIGNLDTELKSEFISTGINQTVHKIYLEIKCNVLILTPFNTMEENITNQILLAEAVIVGTTPSTYYNFSDFDKNAIVDAVN